MMGNDLERVSELGWEIPPLAADGVRYVWSSGEESVSYPDQALDVLGLEGGAGYWFDHRATSVSRILARLRVTRMWEVGSGTGAMASRLIPPLAEVVTVEPLAEGARAAARLGLPAFCGTLQDLQLPDNSIECVGAFDVIEHIPGVAEFLREVNRVLRPGGFLVVTVPAFSTLWGDEDDVAGHQRRYSRKSLVSQLEENGFASVHIEYLYVSLVAPAIFTRVLPYRLGRRRSEASVLASLKSQLHVARPIERIARKVLSTETAFSRYLPLPFGLSVLGVFRAV